MVSLAVVRGGITPAGLRLPANQVIANARWHRERQVSRRSRIADDP